MQKKDKTRALGGSLPVFSEADVITYVADMLTQLSEMLKERVSRELGDKVSEVAQEVTRYGIH